MTEQDVMKLSGLSRQALTYKRLGRPKEKGGGRYKPELINGRHWRKRGWFVIYNDSVWNVIRKKEVD